MSLPNLSRHRKIFLLFQIYFLVCQCQNSSRCPKIFLVFQARYLIRKTRKAKIEDRRWKNQTRFENALSSPVKIIQELADLIQNICQVDFLTCETANNWDSFLEVPGVSGLLLFPFVKLCLFSAGSCMSFCSMLLVIGSLVYR